MATPFYPRLNRQNQNEALFQHKLKPCFVLPKEKEFHPHSPCKVCFPTSSSDCNYVYEELGVRNLLKVVQSSNQLQSAWAQILKQRFESLQVHWGQIEKLHETKVPKLYVVLHQNDWDIAIVAYTLLAGLQEHVEFLNKDHLNNQSWESNFDSKLKGVQHQALFINLEDSVTYLDLIGHKLNDSEQPDVLLVPVSICYEFSPGVLLPGTLVQYQQHNFEWKPSVRIAFGIPHSFRRFIAKERKFLMTDLKKHLHHEIWKNTPIMSIHVLSMILQHRINKEITFPVCKELINEFQKEFRHLHDIAFVGDIENITQYSMKVLSYKGITPTSKAVDVKKLESLMMKSLLLMVDLTTVDAHLDTCRINQTRLLENFRAMADILSRELDFLYPPCWESSAIEKNILDVFVSNCLVSLQSDEPNSDEHQMAKKMALHLDLEFDEEDLNLPMPVSEIYLYVNIDNVFSRKWVASIATSLLDVYYMTARLILELRKVDVMEEAVFIDRISATMNNISTNRIEVNDLREVVRNALKLFIEEGIIESYCHSGIKILYLKDPFNQDGLWRLINKIAQFC